ncbi:MAG: AbrB family transcriptional regulator [Oscillatoriophycideae cyanobacterium NC_groundwater_1537_Pr4_S-0.65um_50_18]|nr:AbrB family transcriptional regulator [Oscillatoriophycideae cyanobacterium NC_groundwater_1537_Pr4_S-0.65um_50_18]
MIQKLLEVKLFSRQQLVILALDILVAIPLDLVLRLVVGSIHWLLSGLIAGAVVLYRYRKVHASTPPPNRLIRQIGLALVGLAIGFSIESSSLVDVLSYIPIFIATSFLLLASCTAIGYLYAQMSGVNLLTALLATIPGNLVLVATIAADYGRNVALVSLVQLIRYTSVILLIPFVARVSTQMSGLSSPVNTFALTPASVGLLLLVALLTGLGVYIAERLNVMAAPYFGALVVGVVFNPLVQGLALTSTDFQLPVVFNVLGQILLGISIGEYWGKKPGLGRRTVGYALASVVLTLIAGFAIAFLIMQVTGWDWLTCVLVAAPGGAAELVLVALTLNHHVELVTAGQVIRLIAINCAIPIWFTLVRRLDRSVG